jgi:hypothetical protein
MHITCPTHSPTLFDHPNNVMRSINHNLTTPVLEFFQKFFSVVPSVSFHGLRQTHISWCHDWNQLSAEKVIVTAWFCVCTIYLAWRTCQEMSVDYNNYGIFTPPQACILNLWLLPQKNTMDIHIFNVPFSVIHNLHCKTFLYLSNTDTFNCNWHLINGGTSYTGTFISFILERYVLTVGRFFGLTSYLTVNKESFAYKD